MIEALGAHEVLLRHEALEPGGFPPEGCAVKILVTSPFSTSEVHTMFPSNEEDEEELYSILDVAEMPIVGSDRFKSSGILNCVQYVRRSEAVFCHDKLWSKLHMKEMKRLTGGGCHHLGHDLIMPDEDLAASI